MAKFLVTGGAGFIGSNIVERLLKDGHFVRVLDNLSSGKLENLIFGNRNGNNIAISDKRSAISQIPNLEVIIADIRDLNACLKACEGIDFVLHQAALRSVPKSLENPHNYNEVNINGTLNMLKASLQAKVKRFVFASSSSIYGDTNKFPEQESDYPRLISPYALTKLAGEYYCRIFSENFGLETISLRYFNVFGPRQALDDEYAVVIPKFITCILNDEQPPIFGNGKQSRDFTYIDNVIEANLLAAPTPEVKCEVLNIANGKDNTVLELVDLLNNIMGKSIKPKFEPIRPGDVFRTLADISKAEDLLGYKPKVDFQEGLKRTVAWFERERVAISGSRV